MEAFGGRQYPHRLLPRVRAGRFDVEPGLCLPAHRRRIGFRDVYKRQGQDLCNAIAHRPGPDHPGNLDLTVVLGLCLFVVSHRSILAHPQKQKSINGDNIRREEGVLIAGTEDRRTRWGGASGRMKVAGAQLTPATDATEDLASALTAS